MRLFRGVAALAAACACALPGAAHAATAATGGDLPVRYDGGALLQSGARGTDGSPDGANDWSCRPHPSQRRPVVLVHGLGGTAASNWATYAPLLRNNGFCVFALTYGRTPEAGFAAGFERMEESSKELGAFVDRVLAATGAKRVDLLGHSEGTVMPRWWLRFGGGAPKVARYVQLTPLWRGTTLGAADLLLRLGQAADPEIEAKLVSPLFSPLCGSCPQFVKGSRYLRAVDAAPGPAEPGIAYTGIATRYDQLVLPYTSGLLDAPNVTNVVLQDRCTNDLSEHLAVAFSPNAAQLALNALAPKRARALRCTPMTPLGAAGTPDVGLRPFASKARRR